MDARRDERMTHAFFSDRREEGESFRVSVEEVTTFFTTCVLPLYNQESNLCSNLNKYWIFSCVSLIV